MSTSTSPPRQITNQKISCFALIIFFAIIVSLLDTETYFNFVSTTSLENSSGCARDDFSISKSSGNDRSQVHPKNGVYQSFNETNPHSNNWCPRATCHNSPLCQPCQRRYLFILATGRSGSTTLLTMFNSLPNIRISGENRNQLYTASKLVSEIRDQTSVLEQDFDRVEGALMHNAIPHQALSCPIQSIMNNINPPPKKVQQGVNVTGNPSLEEYDKNRIFGAKTIRFHKGGWTVKDSADFLREIFPCSRILINIRSDLEGQVKSMTTNFDTTGNNSTTRVAAMNQFLEKLAKELGSDMAKLVDMSKWTKDVGILNDVVQWLGFSGCKFQQIVHENLNGYGRDNKTISLGENCHYSS